jgi:quercetin dioxygenase-like cupin family protein
MHGHLIDFDNIPWTEAGAGVRYKAFQQGGKQIRLIEFSEGFFEKDWCLRGHAGYVLEGSFSVDFNGHIESFSKGDAIMISEGEQDRHKALLKTGERVMLLVFEDYPARHVPIEQ